MTDTPEEIKKLQLKIWLSKPPMERLYKMLEDNQALFQFWNKLRESSSNTKNNKALISPSLPDQSS
jgi:hypothetical protein